MSSIRRNKKIKDLVKKFPNGNNKDLFAKDLNIKIPSSIGRFKNMYALHLDGILDELPSEISNLEDLMFLSLPNNKNLKSLPKEMAEKNGNTSFAATPANIETTFKNISSIIFSL